MANSLHEFNILVAQHNTLTQNVAQYPLHHLTYAPANFEVASPNSL